MTKPISVDEAIRRLASHSVEPAEETVTVGAALGRTLARDITAGTTAPPADVSAMDGYAVSLADAAEAGSRLQVVGEIPAGSVPPGPIGPGQTMRIFTGAPLPPGANHILIQEEAHRIGDQVEVTAPQTSEQYVRKAGRDFARAETLVPAGTRLGPADLALAAAGNNDTVSVLKRPKVAVIPCGNELKPPGSRISDGQIVDSNSTALGALIRSWGGEPLPTSIAEDNVAAIRAIIDSLQEADVIIPVGGASVGDYDFMKSAFEEAGAEFEFAGVAVRPGKPTWFARLGKQRVLGLPGNPASAYVCAHLFLKGLLMGKTGWPDFFQARLAADLPPAGWREAFLRAVYRAEPDGLSVLPLADQDSSLLRPLQAANCLIRQIPDVSPTGTGGLVECLALEGRGLFSS